MGLKKHDPNRLVLFYTTQQTISKKRRSENLNNPKPIPFKKAKKLNRTNALKQEATKQGKPSNFAIFNPINITYFSNFAGAAALYIPEQGENTLYVSGVNYEQAKEEAKGLTVMLLKRGENLMEKIAKQTLNKKLAVDALPIEGCLLYTSPSPRDGLLSRMPSSA